MSRSSRLAFIFLVFVAYFSALAQTSTKSEACAGLEYRQFDFWIGDWDAYDVDAPDKVVAHNHVDLILDHCVIHEVYDGVNASRGESFSIYDSSRRKWHQSWVTNKGVLLLLEGGIENRTMVLQGMDHSQKTGPRLIRGIWKQASGGVRETAETSNDDGKTWRPLFDIVFKLHHH